MKENFNNQFATQKLREENVDETSVSSGVGAYQVKTKKAGQDTYKKHKGERTTGGYIYKDLWEIENIEEILTQQDYEKAKSLLDRIRDKDYNLFMALLALVTSEQPHTYSDMEKKAGLAEDEYNDEWTNKKVKIVKGQYAGNTGVVIGAGDGELDIKINALGNPVKTVGEEEVKVLNESYYKFRNETRTRGKADQFHQAIREVRKKVQEINKVFEYVNRLKNELNEGEHGLKYKKHTEAAIHKLKEMVGQLSTNIKKFK